MEETPGRKQHSKGVETIHPNTCETDSYQLKLWSIYPCTRPQPRRALQLQDGTHEGIAQPRPCEEAGVTVACQDFRNSYQLKLWSIYPCTRPQPRRALQLQDGTHEGIAQPRPCEEAGVTVACQDFRIFDNLDFLVRTRIDIDESDKLNEVPTVHSHFCLNFYRQDGTQPIHQERETNQFNHALPMQRRLLRLILSLLAADSFDTARSPSGPGLLIPLLTSASETPIFILRSPMGDPHLHPQVMYSIH
ncbi:UNVERIFIED_CONTAM: hypothetical protein FKN15_013436 [Acipenser sinensis]